MTDLIRYDLLAQDALRNVVKRVLSDAASFGLPDNGRTHHFYITFLTNHPGVKISNRLKEQYPEEMTIVLQHQFWDLIVSDNHFEVGLSFGAIPERIYIPFEALKAFFDPHVEFGLQFDILDADEDFDEDDDAEVVAITNDLPLDSDDVPEEMPTAAILTLDTAARSKTDKPKQAKTSPKGAKSEPDVTEAEPDKKLEPKETAKTSSKKSKAAAKDKDADTSKKKAEETAKETAKQKSKKSNAKDADKKEEAKDSELVDADGEQDNSAEIVSLDSFRKK